MKKNIKKNISIVWFKRDLRITDHAPLNNGLENQHLLCLYVYENSSFGGTEITNQHLFIEESLNSLREGLNKLGLKLEIQYGEVTEILEMLNCEYNLQQIFSHEETGDLKSYKRDMIVRKWCQYNQVNWIQYPTNGVIRGLKDRNLWSKYWRQRVGGPIMPTPKHVRKSSVVLPNTFSTKPSWMNSPYLRKATNELRQKGYQHELSKRIEMFVNKDCQYYSQGMSSPLTAPYACSRLSPYLSLGMVSIREIYIITQEQLLELKQIKNPDATSKEKIKSLNSFIRRLHWRCHFIQKLEMEPSIEVSAIHPSYDEVYANSTNDDLLRSWQIGATGYPFIDACMRYLIHHGWINFRMRAMLTSFSSYTLHNDWKDTASWLGKIFTDYEPGIHFPQIQMQSGITGINTLRIYNPVKQGLDFDANGLFIKKWIPELKLLPECFIHQPWLMSKTIQKKYGVILDREYPSPVVNHTINSKLMAAKIYSIKRQIKTKEIARKVYEKHGSRNLNQRHKRIKPSNPNQRALIFE